MHVRRLALPPGRAPAVAGGEDDQRLSLPAAERLRYVAGGGLGRRLVAAQVEAERRVVSVISAGVGGDAEDPAVHAHDEVEEAARVAAGEEQREPGEADQQADEAAAGAHTALSLAASKPARRRRRTRR